MIARLAGTLIEAAADHLVLDVNGVGYLALASARTLSAMPPAGGSVVLLTEMQVREDAITLFGFGSAAERDWFRLLTGVQGVGARVALAILSVLTPDDLSRAVSGGDKAMVARAQGVGPKLAERIVRELKDKVAMVALGSGGVVPIAGQSADAMAALTGLGFRPAEAAAAVKAAEGELGAGAGLDAVVRLALKKSAKA